MVVNDNLKKAHLPFILSVSGPISTAPLSVDIVSSFNITATIAGLTFTLPNPTTSVGISDIVEVANIGSNTFTMYGHNVASGSFCYLRWSGTAWQSLSLPLLNDFWRSGVGATTLPDGTTDITENIRRNGFTGINTDPSTFLSVRGTNAGTVANGNEIIQSIESPSPGFGANQGISVDYRQLGTTITRERMYYSGNVTQGWGMQWFTFTTALQTNPTLDLFGDGRVKFPFYPSTRNDAGLPVNILSTDATGIVQSHPITELLSTTLPLSDGLANDTTNRTGSIGIATTAARADHRHPIERITVIPTLPTVTVAGQTLVSSTGTIAYTTAETLTYSLQVIVTPTTVGAWKTINFPNLPGYNLTERVWNGDYIPSMIGVANESQRFMWSNSTFYHAPLAANVNQQHTHNFMLTYTLT